MGFNFEYGISRADRFNSSNCSCSFKERIEQLKNETKSTNNQKPNIVILGAGPAGLLRAIQSIGNGNPTTVIERRGNNASGRINTVNLTATTVAVLQGFQTRLEQHKTT